MEVGGYGMGKDIGRIRDFMLAQMRDSAHDAQHVLRVTRTALAIARAYPQVDGEILEAAALLHDIGRAQERATGESHAEAGARMAREYLLSTGWEPARADAGAACIRTHRFRGKHPPQSLEAQILFDADKVDVVGAIGIARTLMYEGAVGEPLCEVDERGAPVPDAKDTFFGEYNRKLRHLYGRFYTPQAAAMAAGRREAAQHFYDCLLRELSPEEDAP